MIEICCTRPNGGLHLQGLGLKFFSSIGEETPRHSTYGMPAASLMPLLALLLGCSLYAQCDAVTYPSYDESPYIVNINNQNADQLLGSHRCILWFSSTTWQGHAKMFVASGIWNKVAEHFKDRQDVIVAYWVVTDGGIRVPWQLELMNEDQRRHYGIAFGLWTKDGRVVDFPHWQRNIQQFIDFVEEHCPASSCSYLEEL